MSNGCGCERGLLRHIKPPYANMFHLPCCVHDDAYDIGGDAAARSSADRDWFVALYHRDSTQRTQSVAHDVVVQYHDVILHLRACVRLHVFQ